ncbi:MAG: protein phosphatase 2C domain-containing protein [Acidobacteria bacterium]|nr:protein phosphatase 2C domain-containing protein [Acidobacteriota bacterium]
MTESSTEIRIESAAVTDRGLNERRPLNEDSLLNDVERHIFAVADGVGGAEAGEVASKTAIEVLERAFHQHNEGDDPEDLMEIAIQRANASIYKQSREQPKYSMMATTIVALHLDGLRATIGHVGDSRLYRFTPDGRLQRETDDHSVVEEEVRAGRMTAEQAVNHPSRNVISRAIGAESAVEVDLKTIEIEPGTIFLLCSDGITRHIPDEELAFVLRQASSLDDACAEMKKLCFERGAEDNLTAVVIRSGQSAAQTAGDTGTFDDDATLLSARSPADDAQTIAASNAVAQPALRRPFGDGGTSPENAPTATSQTVYGSQSVETKSASPLSPVVKKRGGGAGRGLATLLLIAAASALAFYGGMLYQQKQNPPDATASTASPTNAPVPSTSPATENAELSYERKRRAVDLSPAAEVSRMAADTNNQPLNSSDPEFLYLYGRALLLTGKNQEAVGAFEKSIQLINENTTARNGQLKIDARLATVAAHLRSDDAPRAREAAKALDEVIHAGDGAAQPNALPSPAVSPL